MIQAARTGKQNIAEGSMAFTTSSETEIKLTNVAKASLEELLRRLIERQQQLFLQNGGIREQMTKARIAHRNKERQ